MLDYETDEDAHFQCPQCGQKGSVPKTTLQEALAETPHVYISCSNCSHKFEPFAPADDSEESEEPQTAPPVSPSPLHAHWAQHDDDDETDDEEADGHLPGWMMPIEKPQTEPQNTPGAATETKTDDGSGTLTEEASADEPIKESATSTSGTPDEALEAALEEAIAEEMATDDAPVTPQEPPADETDKTAEGEAIAANTVPTEEALPAAEAPQSDETPTGQEQSQPIESVAARDPEPAEPELEAEPEAAPVEAATNAPLPATPAVVDAPQYETHDAPNMPPSKGPTGMLNGFLLVLVMILLATGIFMMSNNRGAPSSSATPDATNAAAVQLQNAGFVSFTENGEAGIEVSIRFANPSVQVGVIGDFRIELKNQARERLVHWTILSEGETVAPGQTRTLTSVLFGPPNGLTHVDVVYPLED